MTYSNKHYEAMAKAAGYEYSIKMSGLWVQGRGHFHPDTDKAQCFDLMVDTGIRLEIYTNIVFVYHPKVEPFCSDIIEGDKTAATMKAICDCAVEIGR